jgi:two-component system response regulator AtoC
LIQLGRVTTLLQRGRSAVAASSKPPRPASGERRVTTADPTMRRLDALVDVVAPTGLCVLILGETGVGKEVLAERIHRRSRRAQKPLLKINAAALPESVLEGELFGYEKGAFTGAIQARAGLFEAADGGTVFLDEVGELPLATQAKLLRVFENGEVMRVGARVATKVDVRFIAATNRDLRALIDEGKFRGDLYFRLDGMSITLPPLRKRPTDVVPLTELFLAASALKLERDAPTLHQDAIDFLLGCTFPGNVRQLKTVMERTLVLCDEPILRRHHIESAAPELVHDAPVSSAASGKPSSVEPSRALQTAVRDAERQRIVEALAQANGNQKRAAELLGISRRTLINKLELHGVGRPRKGGV